MQVNFINCTVWMLIVRENLMQPGCIMVNECKNLYFSMSINISAKQSLKFVLITAFAGLES